MPQHKRLSKRSSKKSTRQRKKSDRRRSVKKIYYHYNYHHPTTRTYTYTNPNPTLPRAHHYESGSVHDHLNRINHAASQSISYQDEMQRQLKKNEKQYVPNYMHVSSDELAIPAPLKHMQQGMRMFTNV